MEKINLIGGKIELTDNECEKLYNHGEIFIIAYRTIWQLRYSRNAGWYGQKVYYHDKRYNYSPLTKAGRFVAYNGKMANDLIGRKLFIEN
jgi:hypothetical protein